LVAVLVSVIISLQPTEPAAGEVLKSDKDRITSPNVNADDQAMLAEGNSAFAFELYQALKGEEGNLFYSPYSISLALAMTYAGARNETAEQMADTLHEFLSSFLDVLAENYGAGLRLLDFITETEKSRVTINDWVSYQTEGRIKDLVPQGVINVLTRFVLTNAIYFNAAWKYPFDGRMTRDRPFHLLDGGQVSVPMMRETESFGYTEGTGYQAVELQYDGGELSIVILLPASGDFETFEEGLQARQVSNIIGDLQPTKVALTMPRFEFESEFSLLDTLSEMGMPIAFSPDEADFSGMTGKPELYIWNVVHKAFVAVAETGTEAAAATAVMMEGEGESAEVTVTIDRPFIFLIRDIETGAILFVGRVVNPAA
jgi:serpin B